MRSIMALFLTFCVWASQTTVHAGFAGNYSLLFFVFMTVIALVLLGAVAMTRIVLRELGITVALAVGRPKGRHAR